MVLAILLFFNVAFAETLCGENLHWYRRAVYSLNVERLCARSSRELCEDFKGRESEAAGGVGVAVAMAKAVAVASNLQPVIPLQTCSLLPKQASERTDVAQAVLTPFLHMMQMWLASSPRNHQLVCRANPAFRQQTLTLLKQSLSEQRRARTKIRDETQLKHLEAALNKALHTPLEQRRVWADLTRELAAERGGSFRSLQDGLGLRQDPALLQYSAQWGLGQLMRSVHRGQNLDALSELVSSPYETQVFLLQNNPKLCTRLRASFPVFRDQGDLY